MAMTRLNASVLRTLPLFAMLADEEFAALLPSIKQHSYPPRKLILRAGEESDGLYFILSGRVKVLLEDGRGREMMVSSLGPNEFFGEMTMIDGGPRSATVEAHDACHVLYLPAKRLRECLQRNSGALTFVLRTVVERLRKADRKIQDLAFVDVYGRVASTLLDTSLEADGEWLVGPGCEQIASMVGASREMVSRVLRGMIDKGLICRKRRRLIVLDRAALADPSSRGGKSRARTHRPVRRRAPD
jgi:CRP/FNR family cyclic AMP-dependent transcriptional regulator